MSVLETAIRNALERPDRADPDLRARIYQSARHALENGMKKQGVTDIDIIVEQRQRLEALIQSIETEERMKAAVPPAQAPAAPAEPKPERPPEPMEQPAPWIDTPAPAEYRQEPGFMPQPRQPEPDARVPTPDEDVWSVVPERQGQAPRAENRVPERPLYPHREPSLDDHPVEPAHDPMQDHSSLYEEPERPSAPQETPVLVSDRRAPRKRRRSSWFVRIFVMSLLVAFVAIGYYWVQDIGLFLTDAQRDTSVANPQPQVDGGDFPENPIATVDKENSFSDAWKEVFNGSATGIIETSSASRVESADVGGGKAAMITSTAADRTGNVRIPVSAALLQTMSGKVSTIAVSMSTEGSGATQAIVECEFDTLGSCERHRFNIVSGRADYLFKVSFSGKPAPNNDGYLVINSDISGKGLPVYLHSVRILPGE